MAFLKCLQEASGSVWISSLEKGAGSNCFQWVGRAGEHTQSEKGFWVVVFLCRAPLLFLPPTALFYSLSSHIHCSTWDEYLDHCCQTQSVVLVRARACVCPCVCAPESASGSFSQSPVVPGSFCSQDLPPLVMRPLLVLKRHTKICFLVNRF